MYGSQAYANTPTLHVEDLYEVESLSSIASDATAPNRPGPGRILGNLYDRSGAALESAVKKRTRRFRTGPENSLNRQVVLYSPVIGRHDFHHAQSGSVSNDSIASDATAPNLPGPGRTLGLLLDWLGGHLETFLNLRAHQLRLGPEAVANDIRSLRLHHLTSILERHASPSGTFPRKTETMLRKLCKKLLKYTKSKSLATQLLAMEEIIQLTVDDPLVRSILAGCHYNYLNPRFDEPDLLEATTKTLGSIENVGVHALWSVTILRRVESCMPPDAGGSCAHCEALGASLTDPKSSFLAARYLAHALQLDFGLENSSAFADSAPLRAWKYYTNVANTNPGIIEWANINKCISYFSLGNPKLYPVGIKELAGTLVREAIHVPAVFSKFLSALRIDLRPFRIPLEGTVVTSGDISSHAQSLECNLDEIAMFCLQFLEVLSGSEDMSVHLSYARNLDNTSRRILKDTILVNEMCIAYCHLVYHAMDIMYGSPAFEIPSEADSAPSSLQLPKAADTLISKLNSESLEDRQVATFLIARFVAADRYLKLSMSAAAIQKLTRPAFFTCPVVEDHYKMTIPFRSIAFFPVFQGVQHLVRFQIGGKFYIFTNRSIPSRSIKAFGRSILRGHDCAVDIMLFIAEMLCLGYDGRFKAFDATGHYPILAGRDRAGQPLYIAAEGYGESFACIAEGARSVTWDTDRIVGASFGFNVLVLQHNPCDIRPYPPVVQTAKDPSGPLFWLEFWPQKDLHIEDYLNTNCDAPVRNSSQALESFFNLLAVSVNGKDSDRQIENKLDDAFESSGLSSYE